MAVATFLSRIAGLVREQVFAFVFGAGRWTDAFNVAFRIPNLLRDLFAEGAMSAAFVPTFNAALAKDGRERAFRLTNLTLCLLFLVIGAITLVGIAVSPWLVRLMAPEFTANPEKFAATVLMTRIMFPFLLAISWAAIAMGILNSMGEFFLPAIAPVFLNLSMILAGFTLSPLAARFGQPEIVGMAVGAVLGGFLQMAVQFPALWREGYRFAWGVDTRDPGVRQIARLLLPGTLGLAATQINVAVSTILATSQGEGSVSWLSYAFRLTQLPLGIFGVAIAQATIPVIARQEAQGDRQGMAATLGSSIRLTAFINLAATAVLAALAEPIVRLLFQHGRFTAGDTAATALALQAYLVGLFFFSVVKVLGPAFYTLKETRIPVLASLAAVVTNIVLNLALIRPCGYWGLALGSSLASGVNAFILYRVLQRRLGGWGGRPVGWPLIRTLALAVGAGLLLRVIHPSVQAAVAGLTGLIPSGMAATGLALSVSGVLGLVFLLGTGLLLRLEEAEQAWGLIRRRITPRSGTTGPG